MPFRLPPEPADAITLATLKNEATGEFKLDGVSTAYDFEYR